ncbi:hypothetical protein [Actinomadura rugatobispora]|uniref:ATP-binding protein n=1 Tax=Actinomadura rugatobispora TaxID=1994 RepID=A0ABW1AB26_9ACTN
MAESGFALSAECLNLAQASAREITDRIEAWSDGIRERGPGAGVILYLAAHGRLHNGRHYLLSVSSPPRPPYFGSKAIGVEEIVQSILNSGAAAGLILLDTCYSGFAAQEIQQALDRAAAVQGVPGMDLAVLVPSLHHQRSYGGLFVECVLDSLKSGSRGGHWKDGDRYVTLFEMREELRLRLADDQCAYVAGRDGLKIIPNPRYRVDAADRAVELGVLLRNLPATEREHFLRKASSTDAGDVGWFYTGRKDAARTLTDWLERNDGGVFAVTGAPGCGKSAFLGRMAVITDPGSQAACRALGLLDAGAPPGPPVGTFDAFVHIKNRRSDDVARDIALQLGIDLTDSSSPARDLVADVSDSGRRVTVLADALDESEHGEEVFVARDVLRSLGTLPGCRVVVGTRRDTDGRHAVPADDAGPLLETLRPRSVPFEILDLDDEAGTNADIARYVDERLADPSSAARWGRPERRRAAAVEVARQAQGVFLYARFAVRVLQGFGERVVEDPRWRDRLSAAVGDEGMNGVFAEDLRRFPDPVLIKEVLAPLAFARGKGLPRRRVWPELASALSSVGRAYSATDISRTIREAGWYLTEGTEDGEAVFRLYHQAIADYFREEMRRGRRAGDGGGDR